MKTKQEILQALEECLQYEKDYGETDSEGLANNEGWIEALEFVLDKA